VSSKADDVSVCAPEPSDGVPSELVLELFLFS